ncbi:hypothetical protein MJK72_26570 [Klebsiella pneumoniae]|nr:hypothetical protein MJK72_26570 [Klebsiella pneumoniae]
MTIEGAAQHQQQRWYARKKVDELLALYRHTLRPNKFQGDADDAVARCAFGCISADFARLGEDTAKALAASAGCRALRRYGQPLRAKPDELTDGAEVAA